MVGYLIKEVSTIDSIGEQIKIRALELMKEARAAAVILPNLSPRDELWVDAIERIAFNTTIAILRAEEEVFATPQSETKTSSDVKEKYRQIGFFEE